MAISDGLPLPLRAAYRIAEYATGARLTVLIFHRVLARPDPLRPDEPDAVQFESMMRTLASVCRVVSLEDVCAGEWHERLTPRAVAITFDDGYADNATIAVPILRRLGLTATFFVAAGFLDGGRMWNDTIIEAARAHLDSTLDLTALGLGSHATTGAASRNDAAQAIIKQLKFLAPDAREEAVQKLAQHVGEHLPDDLMMSSAQVRAVAKAGMTIGGHTVHHPILTSIADHAAEREIAEGKERLEHLTGRPVTLFAYPNGMPRRDYDHRHVAMVRAAGFTAAVSTAMGVVNARSDRYQMPRFTPWTRTPLKFSAHMIRNLFRTQYPSA